MRVLLSGATGFVGQSLWPALVAAGHSVGGLTRDEARARARWPDRKWYGGDVADPTRLAPALAGCDAAYYLVHGMAEGGADFRRREHRAAECFAAACHDAGVGRIVYLGGFAPRGEASEHLRSRLEVGDVLRGGLVPALELRASMIVGAGSQSWLIVRDLAARLPFMVLPRWLESRTQPVAIDDVVTALVRALDLPLPAGASFDLPGPAVLSGREILAATATALGLPGPRVIEVPVLTPSLSSHWLRFVTRADWSVARELVAGLTEDLLARDDRFWTLVGHPLRIGFPEAARRALATEHEAPPPPGMWGAVERWRDRRARRRVAA